MKRIVTIQDISCVGKCSLTVALPIISAMGVETAVIPTAVLSTHTMFSEFTFADLTDQINPIMKHWKKENIDFDAIYTGYLGSFEQIHLSAAFMDTFKKDTTKIFIDPVMADNGSLYPGFDMNFAREMAKLCGKADVIVPNITEAALMTDMPYCETQNDDYLMELLNKLADLGAKYVVLTGYSPAPDRVGVISLDTTTGKIFRYDTERHPRNYHGTGDVFTSTLVGAAMNGKSMEEALKIACDYTAKVIGTTIADPTSRFYGVNFESEIPYLLERLK